MGNGRPAAKRRFGEMTQRVANMHIGCMFSIAGFFLVAGIILSLTVPPCGICCVLPLGIAFVLAAAKHAVDLKNGKIVPIAPRRGEGAITFESWWCTKPVRLARKTRTPLGSEITVATLCVDIDYTAAEDGRVFVHAVRLSGGAKMEGGAIVNAASVRGEAFRWNGDMPSETMLQAVAADITDPSTGLRSRMLGKWRAAVTAA